MLESALPMTYVDELRECGIILQAGAVPFLKLC